MSNQFVSTELVATLLSPVLSQRQKAEFVAKDTIAYYKDPARLSIHPVTKACNYRSSGGDKACAIGRFLSDKEAESLDLKPMNWIAYQKEYTSSNYLLKQLPVRFWIRLQSYHDYKVTGSFLDAVSELDECIQEL